MSGAASVQHPASPLPSLHQVVEYEASRVPQAWGSRMKDSRPEHVRLNTVLILILVFLPGLHCGPGPVEYSSYETVIPRSLTVQGRDEDPVERASYVLFVQGQKQLIHLEVTRGYFVSDFPVFSYHSGILGQEMPLISRDCHYEGYIEGAPGSFVSVSICSGLRGILVKEGTTYGIRPLETSARFEHALYTVAQGARVSCGVTSEGSRAVPTSRQQEHREPSSPQAPSSLWSRTKYVELFVVVSHQRFQMWGSDVKETVQGVMDITALANSFTRSLNTEVVLVGMEIWTEGDLTEVPGDLPATLRNFNSWRLEQLSPRVKHDVAHMILGHRPAGGMGLAFPSGACSGDFAAAVESFHHQDVLLFVALMVHQLGHNLGIQHDHSACLCKDQRLCLMQGAVPAGSGFSNCSSDHYYQFLREHKGACLFDKPQHRSRRRRDAVCGNGVEEEGEQCDCGTNCDSDPCCDVACTLKPYAQCANGNCCNPNCEFQATGFSCRPTTGICDLPEFCDGKSKNCPVDTYKQDGSKCADSYFCYKGACIDPDIQCNSIYKSSAKSAPPDCYQAVNTKGNRFGNCGGSASSFVKCTAENMYCGKVVCTGLEELPDLQVSQSIIQLSVGSEYCWSMDASSASSVPDKGAVSTGTPCGNGKVCINSACATNTLFDTDGCDSSSMCNGKGICNNLKHCHCDSGFAPPDCSTKGTGGSVDSGSPSETSKPTISISNPVTEKPKEKFLDLASLGIIIALLVILLILVVICIVFSRSPPKEEKAYPKPVEKVERPPERVAPKEAVPEVAAPKEAVPEEAAPKEAASDTAAPTEGAPSEAAPSEAAPSEAALTEGAPSEPALSEGAPSEAALSDLSEA